MALWAFRFLLWYICILIVQPQNRFPILYPLRIANVCALAAIGLHIASCLVEKRPILRAGPATVTGILLFTAATLSRFFGPMQTTTDGGAYYDMLYKNVIIMVLLEAMVGSVQRAWAVYGTLMFSTLWWIKGGVRLATAGQTHGGDRLFGPAVSLVINPNALAYMMCVMIPLYLYFLQAANRTTLRIAFAALALAAVYIALKTGSRTGFILLIVLGVLLAWKFGRRHKAFFTAGVVASLFFFSVAGALNIERFKTIPHSIKVAFSDEVRPVEELTQDEQSAQERRLKNIWGWRLIKDYPVFGVGINADDDLITEKYPFAGGQIHCEVLMAGRQMGFIGIGLYVSLIMILWRSSRRVEQYCSSWWPAISFMGWALKIQCAMFVIGGLFSPIIWHPVLLILVALSSALWTEVRTVPAPAKVEVPPLEAAPIAGRMSPAVAQV